MRTLILQIIAIAFFSLQLCAQSHSFMSNPSIYLVDSGSKKSLERKDGTLLYDNITDAKSLKQHFMEIHKGPMKGILYVSADTSYVIAPPIYEDIREVLTHDYVLEKKGKLALLITNKEEYHFDEKLYDEIIHLGNVHTTYCLLIEGDTAHLINRKSSEHIRTFEGFEDVAHNNYPKISLVKCNGRWIPFSEKVQHAAIQLEDYAIQPLYGCGFVVKINNKWGVLDQSNFSDFEIEPEYDSLQCWGQNRYVYYLNNKAGALHKEEGITLPANYSNVLLYRDAFVKIDNKYHHLANNEPSTIGFDKVVRMMTTNKVHIQDNGKVGIYNSDDDNYLVEPKYDTIRSADKQNPSARLYELIQDGQIHYLEIGTGQIDVKPMKKTLYALHSDLLRVKDHSDQEYLLFSDGVLLPIDAGTKIYAIRAYKYLQKEYKSDGIQLVNYLPESKQFIRSKDLYEEVRTSIYNRTASHNPCIQVKKDGKFALVNVATMELQVPYLFDKIEQCDEDIGCIVIYQGQKKRITNDGQLVNREE